jgi:RNA polymerase sigma factor for flagellar operon FliA
MVPSYSKYIDTDDLMSCGVLGLINAVQRFDVNKGISFKSYAFHRIRGEIIDNLRKQDFLPQNLRHKIKTVENAFSDLENQKGAPPAEEEVCAYLIWT